MGPIYGKGSRSGLSIRHGIFKSAPMSDSELKSETDVCKRCKRPCVEIDHYGERLVGCLGCNRWRAAETGLRAALPIEDIDALRGIASEKRTG